MDEKNVLKETEEKLVTGGNAGSGRPEKIRCPKCGSINHKVLSITNKETERLVVLRCQDCLALWQESFDPADD